MLKLVLRDVRSFGQLLILQIRFQRIRASREARSPRKNGFVRYRHFVSELRRPGSRKAVVWELIDATTRKRVESAYIIMDVRVRQTLCITSGIVALVKHICLRDGPAQSKILICRIGVIDYCPCPLRASFLCQREKWAALATCEPRCPLSLFGQCVKIQAAKVSHCS